MRTGSWLGVFAVVAAACGGDAAQRGPQAPEAGFAPIAEQVGPIPFDAKPLKPTPLPSPPRVERAPKMAAKVPAYALPLGKRQVRNLERDVYGKKGLFDAAFKEAELLQNGMVVVDALDAPDRFDIAYSRLFQSNVPVMVTMDSLLHLHHIYFQEILKALEVRILSPMLEALLVGLHREMLSVADSAGGALREPALMDVAYLSVALALLKPDFVAHPAVRERVGVDLKKVAAHQGLEASASMSPHWPCTQSCYWEDFSQYVPRGHYTQNESLRRYFKASMWLGRITHRFVKPNEILSQALLIRALKRARCEWNAAEVPAVDLLARIDALLDFLIGESDDLAATEIDSVLVREIGSKDLHAVAVPEQTKRLEVALRALRSPRILSNAVSALDAGETPNDTLKNATQGFRLLGQRYAVDSDVLGRLVYEFTGPDLGHPRFQETKQQIRARPNEDFCSGLTPAELDILERPSCDRMTTRLTRCVCQSAIELDAICVKDPDCRSRKPEDRNAAFSQLCRLMPSGLDVASVLGSARARTLAKGAEGYCNYAKQREELEDRGEDHSGNSLYGAWFATFRPLLVRPAAGFPTWMRGAAYEDKALTTMLAAWSELRHDTILYVKQSYTLHLIPISGEVALLPAKFYATVEPVPEVIQGLLRLSQTMRGALVAFDAMPEGLDASLKALDAVLQRVLGIVQKQLGNTPRDQADAEFLMRIGPTFAGLTAQLAEQLAPPAAPANPGQAASVNRVEDMSRALRTTLVTDVHTDLNTGRVLQEGVGRVRWLVAVDRNPDGTLSASIGPVFSHYEFVHKLSDRLTDEAWRELLASDGAPPRTSGAVANGYQRFCTRTTKGCERAR